VHMSPMFLAARLYSLLIRLRTSRAALTCVAPFFRIVAGKSTLVPPMVTRMTKTCPLR
jgi:hypothetical protein